MNRVNWRSVITFYVLACLISWPFFWIRDRHAAIWTSWHFPLWFNKGWLPALGPFLGGLTVCWIFRRTHPRRSSVFGSSAWRSMMFIAVAVGALGVTGIGSDEPHLTGLLFAAVYIVYGFLEETGWRGFLQDALRPLPDRSRYLLQDALRPLPDRSRYLLIGLLWGVWHFTTFTSGAPAVVAKRLALMTVLWIAGSWGIGLAVERSRSLSVAAMLHLGFNFSTALPLARVLPVLGICAVAWWLLLRGWPLPAATPSAQSLLQILPEASAD